MPSPLRLQTGLPTGLPADPAVARRARLPLVLLVLFMVLAACSADGDGDPDADEGASESESAITGGSGDVVAGVAFAPGVTPEVDEDTLAAVADWIESESGLTDMLREEIFLERVNRTRDVQHLVFVQQHGDVSVRGAQFIVHVRDGGEVLGATTSLTETLPGDDTVEELDGDAAIEIARGEVPGEVVGDPVATATWLEVGTTLRLGWEVALTTDGPPSSYAVVVDAADGAVLSVDRTATDHSHRTADGHEAEVEVAQVEVAQAGPACDAPAPPSACIFVVDPIFASGNPDLDPRQANQTLVGVGLPNLLDPTSGDLIGRYAQIAGPLVDLYRDPDGVFGQAGRGGTDITFEAGMTYYWIDYTQQIVQELGYGYHRDDPVDFVPIEPEFPDNAFYVFNEDRIHMGAGGDGINEAEDAQGIVHEYGHALLQAAVPNILNDEGGAFHEGFADLVSVFTTLEFRNGDVPCLFHWADRGICLRRVDGDLTYPDDLRFEVHLDGEIYTGAIWEIFTRVLEAQTGLTPEQCQDRAVNPCDAVRDTIYGTMLGSLPFLTPNLTLDDAATAFAVSDQTFYAGANAEVITAVFGERGLSSEGTPSIQLEGLTESVAARSAVALKVRHSFRGDLAVGLEVRDEGDAVLCSAEIRTPDPDDDADNVTGRFQLDGTTCGDLLPPSSGQRWVLTVADTLAQDEGQLFQFAIIHEGRRYLAPGLPLDIPDADAQGVSATITGS